MQLRGEALTIERDSAQMRNEDGKADGEGSQDLRKFRTNFEA